MNIQKSSRVLAAVLVGLVVIFSPALAFAQLLQILHTNDMHSHFDEAEDRSLAQGSTVKPGPAKGGIAQVKAKIDQLKREAALQGWDSLVLDAGDFSEGTQYFLADQGEQSWRLMDTIGYDAVALGNHDYYIGQKEMDRIVGNVKPRFPVLSANFKHSRKLKNLNKHMKPYVELERGGVKFGIVGLVTNGAVWAWRAGKNVVRDPQRALDTYIDELSARNDYVILLSHLGDKPDGKMVGFGTGIDLVVGGHSHKSFGKPVIARDIFNKPVPIVQAGQHGEFIGRLIVDVQKGKPMVIQSYELIEVMKDGRQDPVVAEAVQVAKERLNDQYGERWLHEIIGYSEIPMVVPRKHPTPWGFFTNEAMKRAANADVAIDDVGGAIYGDNLPAGPITREKLFQFYARVFNADERLGWTVWTVNVRGWALKATIKWIMEAGYEIKPQGVTFTARHYSGYGWHISNLKINGKKAGDFEKFRVALPEGIAMAVRDAFSPARIWLHNPTDTGIPIWTAMETELRRRGGVVR